MLSYLESKAGIVTFFGWLISLITDFNTILQGLVLTISLLIGLMGLLQKIRKGKEEK